MVQRFSKTLLDKIKNKEQDNGQRNIGQSETDIVTPICRPIKKIGQYHRRQSQRHSDDKINRHGILNFSRVGPEHVGTRRHGMKRLKALDIGVMINFCAAMRAGCGGSMNAASAFMTIHGTSLNSATDDGTTERLCESIVCIGKTVSRN
jgi:hypothetical protein